MLIILRFEDLFFPLTRKEEAYTQMNKIATCVVAGMICLFASCSKDTDDKLEGKWQLTNITSGNVTEPVDTVFYNFQNTLFMYQIYDKATDEYSQAYGYKTLQENDHLLLELSYSADTLEIFLPRTGWESAKKDFFIDKVSGKELILSNDGKQYTLRKF